MSIKTYLKAAAVALPLMFSGASKATAQSAQGVMKSAEKVITASDTLKAMDQKAADARTLLLKRYKGHFQGSVKDGKIANGTLNYQEKGHSVPVASLVSNNKTANTTLAVDGSFINAKNLPSTGYKLSGSAEKGNDAFDASAILARGNGQHAILGNVAYTRSFPLAKDLNATGKASVEGVARKINGGDSYGTVAPQLATGLKYQHTFEGGARVGVKGEVGGALPFNVKSETLKSVDRAQFVANAEVEAGYKNVSAFVNGGKDAIMGNNIGGGVRIRF